jgi:hypothetical protein
MTMKIIGMRDIKSNGAYPVKMPSLTIDASSLTQSVTGERKLIKIKSKKPGNNPNFGTILKFEMYLPVQNKMCPLLTVNYSFNIYNIFSN